MQSVVKMTRMISSPQLTAFALILWGATASGSPAHEHGAATLQLSLEGDSLEISLDSPLNNLLGFEHPPVGMPERQQVLLMAKTLKQAQTLFIPTPAARCHPEGVTLSSPVLPPEMLGGQGVGGQVKHPEPPGHADLDASWKFRCDRPALLHDIDVKLFAVFPRFRVIRVQAVVPEGQHYAELTSEHAQFDWKP